MHTMLSEGLHTNANFANATCSSFLGVSNVSIIYHIWEFVMCTNVVRNIVKYCHMVNIVSVVLLFISLRTTKQGSKPSRLCTFGVQLQKRTVSTEV